MSQAEWVIPAKRAAGPVPDRGCYGSTVSMRTGADASLSHARTPMTCHRCGTCAPHPVGAARVLCPGCGLLLPGPDLTPSQRDELRITEGMTGLAARTLVQAAKDRRAARHGGTEAGQ